MAAQSVLSSQALRRRSLFGATWSAMAALLVGWSAGGINVAGAATKNIVANDLTQPQSFSPAGLPTNGDDLSFLGTGTISQPFRLDGSAVLTASSLSNTTSSAVTLQNGGTGVSTLNLIAGTFVTTVPTLLATTNADLTLTGMTPTANAGVGFLDLSLTGAGRFNVGTGRILTVSSAINNNGQLLRLEGGGLIRIGQPLQGSQTISDPTSYGTLSGSGGLTVGLAGTTALTQVSLGGNHSYTGTTTINRGILALTGQLTGTGAIVNNGQLRFDDPEVFTGQSAAGGNRSLKQVISGNGDVVFAAKDTITLGNANTYTGINDIFAGTVVASTLANGGQASSIGAATNAAMYLRIGGGTLRYTGAGASTDRLFQASLAVAPTATPAAPSSLVPQIESSGTGPLAFSNTGAIEFVASGSVLPVVLGGTNTGLNTFAPKIANAGTVPVAFAKTGPGTWRLTGNNTYTGGTFVYGGTLLVPGTGALGTGTTYIGPAGAVGMDFSINNNQLTPGKFTGPGTVLLGGNATETFPISFATNANSANLVLGVQAGRTQTYTGTLTPANNTYRLGGGGGTLNFNSTLVDGTGVTRSLVIGVPLQQTSTFTDIPDSSTPAGSRVVLNGNNTFTGPVTVYSGVVEMGNANALGTGLIRLAGQGTVVPFGSINQAFLSRITSASVGSVALSGDNAANLDFTNAGQTMLGASGNASYAGTLTPASGVYRLGGGGGTLTFNSPLSNSTAGTLAISGNGLPASTVVLNNTSDVATVNVTDAKLTLGPSGALGNANVSLTGAATLDLGGKNVTLNSLKALRSTVPIGDVVVKNGQLSLNGLDMGAIATPFDTNPMPVAEKIAIDLSGLSKLSVFTSSNLNLVASNGQESTIRLAADNAFTAGSTFTLGAASGNVSSQPHALIELGQANSIRVATLDLGTTAGSVAQTVMRFPAGTPGSLTVNGPTTGSAVNNIYVRSGSFSETTLDLSNGTTNVLANNFYAGRHGYTLGTKTSVILGGANSLLNTARLFLNYASPTFDLYSLPPGTMVSGTAEDRFEQREGTVLAGALYLNSHAAGAVGPVAGDTMRSTYVLGTADSQAVLSVHQISLGGAGQNAFMTGKSRATLDFVNGRLETFNPARSTSAVLPQQPIPVSEPTTLIRGLPGGGAMNDFRTLTINLAATGTHTFAAIAGKTLQVESTAVISGPGGLTVEGPGVVSFAGANTYAGMTTLQSGTLNLQPAAQAVILAGGGADVRDGQLNLLVTSGADPVPLQQQVHALLAAGFAQGFAGGPFRSGTATAARGLGYRDNYNGITITPALYGDADLNGTVDFNDFLNLQNAFGTTTTWQGGDFNYDGMADFNDFLALQNNFGASLGGAAAVVTADQVAALRAFVATVPEPGMAAIVLVAASGAMGRRRPAG